ncbi:uncharacterized protein LOC119725936 isoform X3 [Patiria miniata]|uniref:Uncharacterized protein n=1 Tax=Patiria miniata TaxID=46514 RepID=A0A913ZQ49_PATMI|nr:uncharacterized protein LOC119725936 isoform X3 [Patiria miniata]
MTNEYRRLAGSRACFIPLLISIAFAVGYLMGHRSPVQSAIAANQAPRINDDANEPREKPGPAQAGNVRQETGNYEAREKPGTVQAGNVRQDTGNYEARQEPGQAHAGNVPQQTGDNEPREKTGPAYAGNVPQKTENYDSNGSGNTKPGRRPLAFEIVVSHFNEPLDWLKPYAKQSGHVYNKGFDRGPPFDMYKWERLPNVGRESHTYLYHIIENYDNLADVTVFLQGHGSDPDKAFCFADPKQFFINAKRNIFCKQSGRYSNWGRIQHIGKWLQQFNTGKMRAASMTVGEFYKILFGTQPPPAVQRCLTSCFSATRENLLRRPLTFYQKAITFVNDHNNPEESHYFERLWSVIVNAS